MRTWVCRLHASTTAIKRHRSEHRHGRVGVLSEAAGWCPFPREEIVLGAARVTEGVELEMSILYHNCMQIYSYLSNNKEVTGATQSLSCSPKPPVLRPMLVPGQTSGCQSPHLVGPPARREDHSATGTSCCPSGAHPVLAPGAGMGRARSQGQRCPTFLYPGFVWSGPCCVPGADGPGRPGGILPTPVTLWPGHYSCPFYRGGGQHHRSSSFNQGDSWKGHCGLFQSLCLSRGPVL